MLTSLLGVAAPPTPPVAPPPQPTVVRQDVAATDTPLVTVWQWLSGTTWAKVGAVAGWTSLSVEQRHLQPAPWSIVMPYNAQAARIGERHLLTFDFRGQRVTGVIENDNPHSDDTGSAVLELSGLDAMTLIGDPLCWPVPGAPLDQQNIARYTDTGAVETVLRSLILANYARVYGGQQFDMSVAPSQGRGGNATVSIRFKNLLERVTAWGSTHNLGVRVNLKNQSPGSTRADLVAEFYEPQDRSQRVRLSHKSGTLRSWSQSDQVPTGTRVITGGGGTGATRIFRQITDPDAESKWRRRREVFSDARDTLDPVELDARGLQDLTDAAGQSSFDLQALDAAGMRYGDHFSIGDWVAIDLMTGVSTTARLNVVTVTADSSGMQVQLKPGNPDAANPMFALAAIVRGLRKQVRDLQVED